MGIEVRFVDAEDPANFEQAMDGNTRAFFCETVSNVCVYRDIVKFILASKMISYQILSQYFLCKKPALEICDLETVANLAHNHGLPVIVDSTFSTPYLTKPFEFGCDIVVSSLTKWVGGHGAG